MTSTPAPVFPVGRGSFKPGFIPWRSNHRYAFFSLKQKHYFKKNMKLVSGSHKYHDNFTTVKAVINSPNDSNTDSPTHEVISRSLSTNDSAMSDRGIFVRSIMSLLPDPNQIVMPDKSTHKITARAKDDISQHGLIHNAKLVLELVAAELHQKSGSRKPPIKKEIEGRKKGDDMVYEANIEVPLDFGEIGAVRVMNHHNNEIYLHDIKITNLRGTITNFRCESWIHSKDDKSDYRIFFTNKSYLPSQTPSGLKLERDNELSALRGRGDGMRTKSDRIYDYDVYNDLGDQENEPRPILGGAEFPYPRRCRTGRKLLQDKDGQWTELQTGEDVYVPRDEVFSDVKNCSFGVHKFMAFVRALFPSLVESMAVSDKEFAYFTEIETLFGEGVKVKVETELDILNLLPTFIKYITDHGECILSFPLPELTERDRFSWLSDEEFCRQTLAGVNPLSIQLVKEWPLVSKLEEKEYGSPESAITKEMVEQQINGQMTLEEAIEQKKLFVIDYHDMLLPYVKKVRQLSKTTLYGSRLLMFLKPTDELMPIAIELTRPLDNKQPQWKQVFMPGTDATSSWLWKLAKVHVLAHDTGYHQLVSHWLRTHCATEPYIIATNRQLSEMHPIYRLLHPHFRYTMEINALARKSLISAGGVIETGFFPAKYSMELSSTAYKQWRFDLEALPADLINRGMAEEDKNAPHGLKLAIKDYPYANDGLILWDAIEEWVSSYVNHYYPDPSLVESDDELRNWWSEIRTVGHGDKKDGWPVLKTQNDLIKILTIMIWVVSGHHSAVNFGQYDYAGYFPNRPPIARTKMPTEDNSEEKWKAFMNNPEETLLACLPSVFQATIVMGILIALSDHAADEEYIGELKGQAWGENQVIESSYETFKAKLMILKATINRRNADKNLKNRTGAGIMPYKLLRPDSEPGVTGQGVPNSISI